MDVDHVHGAELTGASDPTVSETAIERRFDAIITQDRYRQIDNHVASLAAMRAGLRIVRLVFAESAGVGPSPARQLRSILARRREIQTMVDPASSTRLLVIHENPRRPNRVRRIEEIESEWRERGQNG